MNNEWNDLIKRAKSKLNFGEISSFIDSGNYSCAILTDKGKIYCGVNINAPLLKMSAERAAITNMISNGEKNIVKIIVINELEEIVLPIEDTLTYLMELELNLSNISTIKNDKEIKMIDLLPDWWGTFRISR